MIRQKITFDAPLSFWCDVCDCNCVDSQLPETGKFFQQNGHPLDSRGNCGSDCVRLIWPDEWH